MRARFRLFASLATLVLGVPPAAAQPSFDCTKARAGVERTICADRNLSALDRKMAVAYAAALKRLDPLSVRLLREDQRSTIAIRDWAFERDDFDLAGFLEGRIGQLDAIDGGPRPGYAGTWINVGGSVSIEPSAKGLEVTVSASDGAVGRWVCEFSGIARPVDGGLTVAEPPGQDDNEGWTLRIVREGQSVRVEAIRPAGFEGPPPFCGARGGVDGSYLAARRPN